MAVTQISIEKEFEKNPDLKTEDLDNIRDWVEKQPHLPKVSDQILILFLHSCYYRVEFAEQTLDIYYTMRTHAPEFFADRHPTKPAVINAFDVMSYATMPKLGKNGERVLYFKVKNSDTSKFDLSKALKAFLIVEDIFAYEMGTAEGFEIIFDMEGVMFGHMARLGPLTIKKFLTYLQDAMPVRLKGIHFVRPVPFVGTLLALMKPFIKPELSDTLMVHSQGNDALFEKLGKACLPKDIQGDGQYLIDTADITVAKVNANGDFYLQEEKLRVTESMRPRNSNGDRGGNKILVNLLNLYKRITLSK